MKILTRPVAILLGLTLLIGTAACQTKKAQPTLPAVSVKPVPTYTAGKNVEAKDLADRIFTAMIAAKTYRMKADTRIVTGGEIKSSFDLYMVGVEPNLIQYKGTALVPGLGAYTNIEMILINATSYVKPSKDSKWISTPADTADMQLAVTDRLKNGSATYIAPEGWQGSKGHHFTVVSSVADFIGPKGADKPGKITWQVWTDEQLRLTHQEGKLLEVQEGVNVVDVTADFSEYGTPVEIKPPAEADVEKG